MKKLFRLTHGFRLVMLAAAALAVYLPASNLPQPATAGQKQAPETARTQLPDSLKLASANTSWQVFASGH